jgi:RND family efflux transporter MFP subunit
VSLDDVTRQLKIERDPLVPRRGGSGEGRWGMVFGLGAGAAIVVLAAIYFLITRPDLVSVQVAEAKPVWSGAVGMSSTLLDASGYVVAQREATVSAKVTGKVAQVMIEEGQHVVAGQVIATIDNSNAKAALDQAIAQAAAVQATVRVAEASLEGPQSQYNRSKSASPGILSAQSIQNDKTSFDTARENLELARRQAAAAQSTVEVYQRSEDDTVVRAPFAGVVTATAAQPGEIVAPVAGGGFTRTGICTIVDMDSLEVDVDVAESFISRVTPGMSAIVKLDAYPDWEIPAQVITVIPTADRSKGTVTVRVGFKVKDSRIIPEMGAHVAFLSPTPAQGSSGAPSRSVTVPPDAVQTEDGGQAVVFVIEGGRAQRRAIRLGDRNIQGQIVVAGLAPGEIVAVEGADHLKDGAGVKIAKNKSD